MKETATEREMITSSFTFDGDEDEMRHAKANDEVNGRQVPVSLWILPPPLEIFSFYRCQKSICAGTGDHLRPTQIKVQLPVHLNLIFATVSGTYDHTDWSD